MKRKNVPGLWAGQLLHLACLAVLLALAWVACILRSSSSCRAAASSPITTTILGLIWVYAAYSINRHFGFARGAGADHFDPRYRTMPLVREGIFRFTSNGMYVYGFLFLWAIAIGFNSTAALIVAAFSHAYIWVHFHATEKPDMGYLYSSAENPG